MDSTSNIKDKLSTFCGILGAITGGILISGVDLPAWLKTVCGATSAVCLAVIGFLTGKTPAAKPKTEEQVVDQNLPKP